MKKVGKYIILTFLLLIGLGCVGILYLFFVPGASLFNITYINLNKKETVLAVKVSEINVINLNSRAYDVNIVPSKDDNVSVEIFSNNFGFVLVKNKATVASTSIKDNVLNIDIAEAYGFATKNNSYINLYIPSESPIDLNLSNKKAQTSINSGLIDINNLSYKTNKGNFNFKAGKINGKLSLDIGKSTFILNKNVMLNKNDDIDKLLQL